MAEIGSPSVLSLFRLPRCLRPFAEVIGVAGAALSLERNPVYLRRLGSGRAAFRGRRVDESGAEPSGAVALVWSASAAPVKIGSGF
jgi:hypothetical protein